MGILSKALAQYSGPYKVATTDLEIPVEHQSFGTALLQETRKPALELDTALFTLFYPANPHRRGSGKHQDWLQRPLSQTAAGYARFTNKSQWLTQVALFLLAARTKLPAEMDLPLADKEDSSASGDKEMKQRVATTASAQTSTGTLVEGASEDQQFPLVVFSHGLGGGRTTYSQFCGEIASQGYIVASIEHRDGSGPVTVVRNGDGTERVVNYIKPEDLLFEPPNPILSQLEHRKEQLVMRLAEVDAVLKVMKRINDGEGAEVAALNRRREPEGEKDLVNWKGRIDLKKEVTMAGHSFGGATLLQTLRAGAAYPFVRGIALDPWVDPIPPWSPDADYPSSSRSTSSAAASATPASALNITVPLLVINSEAFTLWQVHYRVLREIVRNVKDGKAWFMSLVGSIHLSFSDFPLIQPFIASRSGARIDSKLAISTIVEASVEFLKDEGTHGKILGQKVVPGDEEGTRPDEGYEKDGKKPMEPVGAMRMHLRPEDAK